MVLSDRVDVPRQGTVAAEARPLLHANHRPRAIEVREASKLGSETRAGPGFQERIWSFVSQTSAALVRLKSGGRDKCI